MRAFQIIFWVQNWTSGCIDLRSDTDGRMDGRYVCVYIYIDMKPIRIMSVIIELPLVKSPKSNKRLKMVMSAFSELIHVKRAKKSIQVMRVIIFMSVSRHP